MTGESGTLRKAARRIFEAAVKGVMPHRLIGEMLSLQGDTLRIGRSEYSLRPGQKIYLFGSGKGSAEMARSVLSLLRERIAGGVIVTYRDAGQDLFPLMGVRGSHPVPDDRSIRGAELLIDGLSGLGSDDFFLYLLSGGSSALIEKPLHNISLAEMQQTTRLLLESGVPIHHVNAVRKHLSMVKGGRLVQRTRAAGAVLVISDVINNDLSVIGSGPFYADPTTFHDCREILGRAAIWDRLAPTVRAVIESGARGEISETLKQPPQFIDHYLIGTNRIALEGARRKAEQEGLKCHVLTSSLSGEAREVAKVLMAIGHSVQTNREPFSPPCCLLFGGETTVTVRGSGKGGRNQELVLAALAEMKADDEIVVLSGGTDGIDGNSTAAGAVADSAMLRKAGDKELSIGTYLDDNNSNEFFRRVGGLLETGATGTNVMDITLLIIA